MSFQLDNDDGSSDGMLGSEYESGIDQQPDHQEITDFGAGLSSFPTQVEVRRSSRRRKSVEGRIEDDRLIIMIPSRLPAADEERCIEEMRKKLQRKFFRRQAQRSLSDEALADRARRLSKKYVTGAPVATSFTWGPGMVSRWGSCSQQAKTIRINPLLAGMPRYVLDYVIVHELTHLIVPGGHTQEFWDAVHQYPRTERAIGYLEAVSTKLRGDKDPCRPGD